MVAIRGCGWSLPRYRIERSAIANQHGDRASEGETPVNPIGSLLKGHPICATGVAQINELSEQLHGATGNVQVTNDPTYGLQHTIAIGRNATGSVSCDPTVARGADVTGVATGP